MTDIQQQLDQENDARYEAQEALQAVIDTEVELYMKNLDILEELITENADVIAVQIKNCYQKGMTKKELGERIMTTMSHYCESLAEGNL